MDKEKFAEAVSEFKLRVNQLNHLVSVDLPAAEEVANRNGNATETDIHQLSGNPDRIYRTIKDVEASFDAVHRAAGLGE